MWGANQRYIYQTWHKQYYIWNQLFTTIHLDITSLATVCHVWSMPRWVPHPRKHWTSWRIEGSHAEAQDMWAQRGERCVVVSPKPGTFRNLRTSAAGTTRSPGGHRARHQAPPVALGLAADLADHNPHRVLLFAAFRLERFRLTFPNCVFIATTSTQVLDSSSAHVFNKPSSLIFLPDGSRAFGNAFIRTVAPANDTRIQYLIQRGWVSSK